MGIVASKDQYEQAIRRLFPQGAWWEEQLADPQSDISLWAQAKAQELYRFRRRMEVLFAESKIDTTDELIAEWERVLLGEATAGKGLDERRRHLRSRENEKLNRAALDSIAERFGLVLRDVSFPYRPGLFGHARMASERIGGFAAFSVVLFSVVDPDFDRHYAALKAELAPGELEALRREAKRAAIWRGLRRGCFGHSRPARDRLIPFRTDAARALAIARLAPGRLTALRFGVSRLVRFAGRFDPAVVIDADFFERCVADIFFCDASARRFKRALIDGYLTRMKPYRNFEEAIGGVLLANNIPIYHYGGET